MTRSWPFGKALTSNDPLSGGELHPSTGEEIHDKEPSARRGGDPATIVGPDDPLTPRETLERGAHGPAALEAVRPRRPITLAIARRRKQQRECGQRRVPLCRNGAPRLADGGEAGTIVQRGDATAVDLVQEVVWEIGPPLPAVDAAVHGLCL